jgi:cytochrome b561
MRAKLFTREVIPFLLSFIALVIATMVLDAVLHFLNVVWIGRYLGIVGTLLIVFSFRYSLRKRKLITSGNPVTLLRWHEYLAWLGSLLILVHAGIHFNSILGWLAVGAMLINIGSGLAGKFLLERARKRMLETRQTMLRQGVPETELEEQVYLDTMTFDVVKQWRAVHFPITLAFGVLALAHIIAVFLFWGWK